MNQLQCPKCYAQSIVKGSFSTTGKRRWRCTDCGHRTVAPLGIEQLEKEVIDPDLVKQRLKEMKGKKKFVITSAQNATPVHKEFLKSLHTYCDKNDAFLIVIPYRYHNPTSVFADSSEDWWYNEVEPYLINTRIELSKNLVLLADIKLQPTAKTPLTGIEGFTSTASCIVGHPKYQLSSVATRQGDMAKLMSTTGSVTLKNYTNSKAGKVGNHHHVYGAAIVELDGDLFHVRHVSAADDGSFIDLDKEYTPTGVNKSENIEALVMGDLHHWFLDPSVDASIFGKDGVVNALKPKKLILHDVIDFYSASHHHRLEPFIKYAKHKFGKNNIKQEIEDFCDYLIERIKNKKTLETFIIPSNHDDHMSRYIREVDWRTDPENSEFYLETALHMLRQTKFLTTGSETPKAFKYWLEKYLSDHQVKILDRDESLEIANVEHALHGDLGSNGSRGSVINLTKIGVKATIGHSHTPAVRDGVFCVGHCTGGMEYAKGPSSWLTSHCILYSNGKRTLIHSLKGRWRAD